MEGAELIRLSEDMSGDPDSLGTADDADVPLLAFRNNALEARAFLRFKANKPSEKLIGAGVAQAKLRVGFDSVAHLAGQFVDAPVDPLGTNRFQEIKRRLQSHHHREIRGSHVGEAIGFQLVIAPLGGRGVDPEALEELQ